MLFVKLLSCAGILLTLSLSVSAVEKYASSMLYPLGDHVARGVVKLVEDKGMIRITGEISGLKPGSLHGFHMHDFGDCSSPDGQTAGGHFNPEGHAHAGPKSAERHFGDFGNIEADENGVARIDIVVPASVGLNRAYGRGLIVHADQDDEKTNPAGNAGPRIACGVVGVSQK